MSPKELLNKLKASSSPRTQKSLDAVYEVCSEQIERGASNFSYSLIAKLGRTQGVPSKQTIHNKTGEKYRVLIDCFAKQSADKLAPSTKQSSSWTDDIENPTHRLLARQMEAQLREATKQLNQLVKPDSEIFVYDNNKVSDVDTQLTRVERRALEYLLSDTFKSKWKFEENEFGEYVDPTGRAVFRAGTLDAIRKVLSCL